QAEQLVAALILGGAHHGWRFAGGEVVCAQVFPLFGALLYLMNDHSATSPSIAAIWLMRSICSALRVYLDCRNAIRSAGVVFPSSTPFCQVGSMVSNLASSYP